MAEKNKTPYTCKKCGHVWVPRSRKVNKCPKCKTKYWNTEPEKRGRETQQGRPRVEINQELFERLCGIQCTRDEICEFMQVSSDALDRWCKDTYEGKTFSEVFELKRVSGKLSLRRTLFQQAQTTPSVAIFLAKNWLGMADKQDVDLSGSVSVVGTGYPGKDKK